MNDNLLPGPDLLQKLVGTLFNLRKGAVALNVDIEQMFLHVKVKEDVTHCLRYLYSDVENEVERIVIYKYNRQIFGAKSSLTCVNYALTRTLEVDNLHQLSNRFYIDDFIFSLIDQLETENFKKHVVEVLLKGGFKMTKFQSNVEKLSRTPKKKKEPVLALGWRTDSDILAVCGIKDKSVERFSRVDLLSMVSSLFDPSGLFSFFTLRTEKYLERIWKQDGVDWDKISP